MFEAFLDRGEIIAALDRTVGQTAKRTLVGLSGSCRYGSESTPQAIFFSISTTHVESSRETRPFAVSQKPYSNFNDADDLKDDAPCFSLSVKMTLTSVGSAGARLTCRIADRLYRLAI